MSEQLKTCGTCRYFNADDRFPAEGECQFPLPKWLSTAISNEFMGDGWGRGQILAVEEGCPCHTPREEATA